MEELRAYKLVQRQGSSFHFGLRGIGAEVSGEYCPSDTLFAALVAVAAEARSDPDAEGLCKAFAQSPGGPPFLLSSAFPFARDVRLLPVPKLRLKVLPRRGLGKLLKNLAYISEGVFRLVLAGERLDELVGEHNLLQNKTVLVTPSERSSLDHLALGLIWTVASVPRVTVDRVASGSEIYHVGRVSFAPECGLYFLVKWRDDRWRASLEELLRLLGDAGLGGRRSVGHGQFDPVADRPMDLPVVCEEGSRFVTLSRYHPTLGELGSGVLGPGASYGLSAVGGWLSSPGQTAQRRRVVRMIDEGSVLRHAGQETYGDLPDVRPAYDAGPFAHPVYRYGFAFPVAVSSEAVAEEEGNG